MAVRNGAAGDCRHDRALELQKRAPRNCWRRLMQSGSNVSPVQSEELPSQHQKVVAGASGYVRLRQETAPTGKGGLIADTYCWPVRCCGFAGSHH